MIIQGTKNTATDLGLDKAVFADVVPVIANVVEPYGTILSKNPEYDNAAVQYNTVIVVGNTWYRYLHSLTGSYRTSIDISTDGGVSWNTHSNALPYSPMSKIIYVESLRKFYYISDLKFNSSSDCLNWSSSRITFDGSDYNYSSTMSLLWNDKIQKFVCICYSGVFEGSADGKTWTKKATYGSSKYTNSYTDYGDYYVGASQYSTDGDGTSKIYLINKSTYAVTTTNHSIGNNHYSIVKAINDKLFVACEGYLYTFTRSGTTLSQSDYIWYDGCWTDVIYDEKHDLYMAVADNESSDSCVIYVSSTGSDFVVDYSITLPKHTTNLLYTDECVYIIGYSIVRKSDKITGYNTQLMQGQNGTVIGTLGINILCGAYIGTGANKVQDINLGVRPKAVYIQQSTPSNPYVYSALILDGYPQYQKTGVGTYNYAQITSTGFSVGNTSNSGCQVNNELSEYYYIAFV